MGNYKTFPFHKARKITTEEHRAFRRAIKNTLGYLPPRRGRPQKGVAKYQDIHIKIHPRALKWARLIAKKRGVGYQTVINETLLSHAR